MSDDSLGPLLSHCPPSLDRPASQRCHDRLNSSSPHFSAPIQASPPLLLWCAARTESCGRTSVVTPTCVSKEVEIAAGVTSAARRAAVPSPISLGICRCRSRRSGGAGEGVQAELAETFRVSQPTISRVISAITPPQVGALRCSCRPPTNSTHLAVVVDGTLLPCWCWPGHASCTRASTGRPA